MARTLSVNPISSMPDANVPEGMSLLHVLAALWMCPGQRSPHITYGSLWVPSLPVDPRGHTCVSVGTQVLPQALSTRLQAAGFGVAVRNDTAKP